MAEEVKDRVFRMLRSEKRQLPVKLAEDEWASHARRLAAISEEADTEEGAVEGLKAQVKEHNARLESLSSELRQEARLVRTGVEPREVEVMVEVEQGTNIVYERRTDTNVVIHTRAMTLEEQQIDMFREVRESRPKDEEPERSDGDVVDVTPKALPAHEEEPAEEPEEEEKKPRKRRGKKKEPDISDLDEPDEE